MFGNSNVLDENTIQDDLLESKVLSALTAIRQEEDNPIAVAYRLVTQENQVKVLAILCSLIAESLKPTEHITPAMVFMDAQPLPEGSWELALAILNQDPNMLIHGRESDVHFMARLLLIGAYLSEARVRLI